MAFHLTIKTDGAAFTNEDTGEPNPGPEVARLLEQIAREIRELGITGDAVVRDYNGARVGSWSLDEG